jgi:uncharacterized protein YpmB
MEFTEKAPKEVSDEINEKHMVYVPVATRKYKTVHEIPPLEKSRKYDLFKLTRPKDSYPEVEQSAQGMYYPIRPLDLNDPDDTNVVNVEGKGPYVQVIVGRDEKGELETRWVPYTEITKRGNIKKRKLA